MLLLSTFFRTGPSRVTCCLLFVLLCLQVVADPPPSPRPGPPLPGEIVSEFKSRPDLFPSSFTVELSIPEKLSPGYIFVGPYEAANPGPYIYDTQGNLVWSGWGSAGPGNAHGMHVCRYKGEDHLCFFQGQQQKGYCRGHGIIMDKSYRIVRSVQPGGGMASSDMHEFKLINDGKTALLTVYQQRQFDMSPWNIKTGVGWVMESIFQEVDVETNQVLFEWRSLDHVDPSNSYTFPDHTDTSGTGLDPGSPWDYFHINSIEKNQGGDYLISSRHMCAIYKISGKNGSIIWQLHGAHPTFKNLDFSFSQQHDARWLHENATHTLVSLYNNGYNGFNKTHTYSSGMVILIDHMNLTARMAHEYLPPGKSMLSSSQGNVQVLPNKNAFLGWGNNAYVSEHDEEGNLLFWGYLAKSQVMNYRAQKFQWDGTPTDSPALWTYAKTSDVFSPTTFYVSWNGATRVKYWRFYGASNITGPYVLLDEVEKVGFETVYTNANYFPWSHVEAIDWQGKVLGQSRSKYTFVPSPELSISCEDDWCKNAVGYGFSGVPNVQANRGDPSQRPFIPPAGINTVPWVDPEHPENHYDGKESQLSQIPEETEVEIPQAIYDHSDIIMMVAGGVILLVGLLMMLKYYRRHRRFQRLKQHGSSSTLNTLDDMEERKPSDQPWINWRWWHEDEEYDEDEHHYVPVAERQHQ